ncbi:MAG: YbhB/YbcL family Raf kinase inhibitor-like protein [Archaeoglobus sp.]|nr:MAG: YbhB/YbcL family Raf kinase inhibitor-like protein [Archaeoglobus sp.]
MKVKIAKIALACTLCLLCCCVSQNPVQIKNAGKINVSLPFHRFPDKYTCKGEDISPPVSIKGVKNAKSLAIVMIDLDAPKGIFVHWVAWNIPANVTYIPPAIPKKPVVEKPVKMVQGRNDFGNVGYDGPCPPFGTHRYVIRVYSLNCWLNLKPGVSANTLYRAMNGHVVQIGSFTATYP